MTEYINKLLNSLYDFRDMFTMEETFVLTGISIAVVSVVIGLLLDRLFKKDNKKSTED